MECNLTTLGISFGKLDRRGFLRGRQRGVYVAVPRDWALGGCGVRVGAQVSLLSGLLLLRSCVLGHEWLPGYGIRWAWLPRRTPSSLKKANRVAKSGVGGREERGEMFVSVSVESGAPPREKLASEATRDSYPRADEVGKGKGGCGGARERQKQADMSGEAREARQLNGSHTASRPNRSTRSRGFGRVKRQSWKTVGLAEGGGKGGGVMMR